jgi:ferrochelatase
MSPLDFLRWYDFDERVLRGGYYPSDPLEVQEGERVGVVLLNRGGPETLDDIESYLYNCYMDPTRYDFPVGGRLRHWACQMAASYRAPSVRDDYEVIGGGSPLTRLAQEQADSLQQHLNDEFGAPTGIDFRTYVAMRYWHPFSEAAAAQMEEDGIDRVVLLPLHPQYSKSSSGSSLARWKALEERGEIPSWPTTTVTEYAANPKFIRALSERIDEGLQRFPRERRGEVQLLFSAQSTSLQDRERKKDPYCCLVHSTVEQVMRHRGRDRPFRTAFQNTQGLQAGLSPTTTETLGELADTEREQDVLIVPVSYVSDHFETNYVLDIEVREAAERAGLHHYEVTSALNTHPLFIQALGEATIAQLELPVDVNQLRVGGDGLSQDYPLRPLDDMPRHNAGDREAHCPNCGCNGEARRWTVAEDAPDSGAVQASREDGNPEDSSTEASESQ